MMTYQHVTLLGTKLLGEEEKKKDFIELKHVNLTGTRIFRIPANDHEAQECAPAVRPRRRRGLGAIFRNHHH